MEPLIQSVKSIHPADWMFGAAFAASVIVGAWRGVFKEISGVAAAVFGFIAASVLKERAEPFFERFIENPHAAAAASFLAIYAAVGIFFFVTGRLMRTALRAVRLGWIDYLGGLCFGVLRAFLLAGLFLFVWTLIQPLDRSPFAGSRLAGPLLTAFVEGTAYFGDDLAKHLDLHFKNPLKSESSTVEPEKNGAGNKPDLKKNDSGRL